MNSRVPTGRGADIVFGMDRKWVTGQGLLALGLAVGTSLPWLVENGVFGGRVTVTGWSTSIGLAGVSVPVWLVFAASVFAVLMAGLRSADLWDGPPWIEAALLVLGVGACAVAVIVASANGVGVGAGWFVSTLCIGTMAVRAVAVLLGRSPLHAAPPAAGVPSDYLGLRRSRSARLARRKRAEAARVVLPVIEPEPPAAE